MQCVCVCVNNKLFVSAAAVCDFHHSRQCGVCINLSLIYVISKGREKMLTPLFLLALQITDGKVNSISMPRSDPQKWLHS